MTIIIPRELKSDINGFEFFSGLAAQTMLIRNEIIFIDFSNCMFFEGNLCAVLGAILDGLVQRKNELRFLYMSSQIKGFMSRNKFLSAFNDIEEVKDNTNSTIFYKKFNINDEIAVKNYIENELLNKPELPIISDLLKKHIVVSISEIYSNAITHGHCDYVFSCGQSYPRRSQPEINFTFVDLGKTIKSNVMEYLKLPMTGKNSLIWATSNNNSTKVDNHPGGLGLKIIQEFATFNNGKIQIVSADGYWEFTRDHISVYDISIDFPGTIVNIIFNINDNNRYIHTSETDNFQNLF